MDIEKDLPPNLNIFKYDYIEDSIEQDKTNIVSNHYGDDGKIRDYTRNPAYYYDDRGRCDYSGYEWL